MYAVYSGAKAYVELFSRSLYAELKPFGVTVQVRARGSFGVPFCTPPRAQRHVPQ